MSHGSRRRLRPQMMSALWLGVAAGAFSLFVLLALPLMLLGLDEGPPVVQAAAPAVAPIGPDKLVMKVGDAPNAVPLRVTARDAPPTHRQSPAFPDAARAAGLTEGHCQADVFLKSDGAPYRVEVGGCDPVFRVATAEALQAWRWPESPHEARRTLLAVNFEVH